MKKKPKIYTGMVGLYYRLNGIPMTRYVMAFYNTAKELKEDFLPGCKSKEVTINKV